MSGELKRKLSEVRSMVNEEILRIRGSKLFPRELYEAAFHLLVSGGKRLRPLIVLESHQIFSTDFEKAFPIAVAVELLHNFTLIHDDIMDEDEMRRGVETTHVIWGVPVAITAGDVVFSYLFKYVVSELREKEVEEEKILRVVESLADGAVKICEGQIMDLLSDRYINSEEKYFEMVKKKTGVLFKISSSLGGLVGGASGKQIKFLEEYGENLGVAFQITDDILGVVGNPSITGKPVGNDIREGKKTLIIIHALRNASATQNLLISSCLGKRNTTNEEISRIVEILREIGSIDYARTKAAKYSNIAVKSLRTLPRNEHRETLESLAKFIISREM